uniref:Virion structural protein n=1 Tax=Pseudomonas phage HRDY3 TaxID=3236930 RepID=A0AB39CEY6_9VIRU
MKVANTNISNLWIFIGLAVIIGFWTASINNTLVTQEEGIVGANKSRQATLSNISQKIKEAIGVQDMNVENIRKTVNEQIATRAGDGGLKATMLFLQENNIAPSQALAEKIVNLIDQGREKFLKEEKMMQDRKTVSCTFRGRFPNNMVINTFGLADLKIGCKGGQDDYAPLMNDRAARSFETGQDQGLYELPQRAPAAAPAAKQ